MKQTQNEAKQRKAKAEGELAAQEALRQALTPEYLEYLRIQACQQGNCTLVLGTNGGTNINVPSGGGR